MSFQYQKGTKTTMQVLKMVLAWSIIMMRIGFCKQKESILC